MVAGIVMLAVPIATIAWWIFIAESTAGDHAAKVAAYLEVFPAFLRDTTLLTFLQLGFAALSGLFFFNGIDGNTAMGRVSLILFCLSGLIGFWLLFTLM